MHIGMGGSSGINPLGFSIGVTAEYTKEFLRFDVKKESLETAFDVDTSDWASLSSGLLASQVMTTKFYDWYMDNAAAMDDATEEKDYNDGTFRFAN